MSEGRRSRAREADDVVIEALAAGSTYAEAGAKGGVSERTVRRRMTDPEFAAEVSARRGEQMSKVTGLLVEAAPGAVRAIVGVLESGFDPYPQMRAAQLILNTALRYRESHELEARLQALEARLAGDVTEAAPVKGEEQ